MAAGIPPVRAVPPRNSPDSVDPRVARMRSLWALPAALRSGTEGMRAGGLTWLPQKNGEAQINYDRRLSGTFLTPGYSEGVRSLASKPFLRSVVVSDDADPLIQEIQGNVDLEGTELRTFLARAFDIAIDRGMALALTDMPPTRRRLTLGQEREQNLRPYWIAIHPDQMLGFKTATFRNVEVLTQFRYTETSYEADRNGDEFLVEPVTRIRVYDRFLPGDIPGRSRVARQGGVFYRVFVQRPSQSGWALVDEGPISLPYIPLRALYTERRGFLEAEPPLKDLAYANLEHWQSSSEQRHILRVARIPMLWGAGWKAGDVTDADGEKPKIGSDRMLLASDYRAKLDFAEHSGKAIGDGRQDLVDIEDKMLRLSLRPLVEQDRTILTATEAVLRSSDQISDLTVWASSLETFANLLSEDSLAWMNSTGETGISVWKDFASLAREARDILEAQDRGILSRQTTFEELMRRGVLKEGRTWDDEMERMTQEALLLGPAVSKGSPQSPDDGGNGDDNNPPNPN